MWQHDALVSSYVMPWCESAMLLVSSYEPACGCVAVRCVPVNTHNLTLAHHRVPSSSVVEHPTRSQRVVGSIQIWDSDFFRVYVSPRIYIISCCGFSSVDKFHIDIVVLLYTLAQCCTEYQKCWKHQTFLRPYFQCITHLRNRARRSLIWSFFDVNICFIFLYWVVSLNFLARS